MTKKKTQLRSYFVNGVARDQEWIVSNREMVESYARDNMRENGFVPLLNEETQLFWEYDKDSGNFKYKLELKAMWLGKKAKYYMGVLDGVLIDNERANAELIPA